VLETLEPEATFDREWDLSDWSGRPDQAGDFFMRATRDHGAVGLLVSASWQDRSVAQMRLFGRELLGAFCAAL
jgi:hypothetical protein